MINITNEGKYTLSADILEQSKRAVVLVEDKNLRKKMYASMVAINAFIRQMKEKGLHLDTRESLTRVHSLIEDIDLSNVVYRNLQLDIRVIINGNQIFIPKSHLRHEIVPDIYVGARLNKDFNYIEFLGFIETSKISTMEDLKEYYGVSVEDLRPMDELVGVLHELKPAQKIFDDDTHSKIQELFINYYDNKLSRVEKLYLLRHLFYCMDCRKKFINFYDFDVVAKHIQHNPEILSSAEFDITNIEQDVPEFKIEEIKNVSAPQKIVKRLSAPSTLEVDFFSQLKDDLEKEEEAEQDTEGDFVKSFERKLAYKKEESPAVDETEMKQQKNHFEALKKQLLEKNEELTEAPKVSKNRKKHFSKSAQFESVVVPEKVVSQPQKEEANVKTIPITETPFFRTTGETLQTTKLSNWQKFLICVGLFVMFAVAVCGYSYYKNKSVLPWNFSKVTETKLVSDASVEDIKKPSLASSLLAEDGDVFFEGLVPASKVERLSWEVLPEYAENEQFVDFLQNSGVSIQANLQEAFILYQVDELQKGSFAKINFSYDKNKGVKNFVFEQGTGSPEIDNLVKDSILTTLKNYSYPEFDSKVKSIDFKLLIEF